MEIFLQIIAIYLILVITSTIITQYMRVWRGTNNGQKWTTTLFSLGGLYLVASGFITLTVLLLSSFF